jgi:hypothetical protein
MNARQAPGKARKSNRNSVRNPDNSRAWRDRQVEEGWVFVQFWARPETAAKLQRLVDEVRAVMTLEEGRKLKPKEIIEDLILKA